jgi:hypothetical protein
VLWRYVLKKDGQWHVWTDCEVGHFYSGRCVGVADTRDAALDDAVKELREDLRQLEAIVGGRTRARPRRPAETPTVACVGKSHVWAENRNGALCQCGKSELGVTVRGRSSVKR